MREVMSKSFDQEEDERATAVVGASTVSVDGVGGRSLRSRALGLLHGRSL